MRTTLVLRALPPLWAALCALAAASALTLLHGESPRELYRLLWAGTWGSAYGIGQVLFKATPLLFCGLGVAMALRAGLFNIGAEGQITVGAFAAALSGAALPAATPAWLALPTVLLCAFGAGAALGAVAGLFRWLAGAHEVIVTMMLNFVVRAAMVGLGGHVFLRESVHTAPVVAGAELPRLSRYLPALHGSAANASLLLGLLVCAGCALLLSRTRAGFVLRTLGSNEEAARAAGVHVGRTWTWALALAGGVAGLGGTNFVLGYKHYYEDGFSGGVGYMGIAVAVLGHNRPLGVLLAALLFGTLSQGGLAVHALVPRELIDVLTAVVLLTLAASQPAVQRLLQAQPGARREKEQDEKDKEGP
ncbi:MAG: ABC transporter permease [Myxococcales bacterium]|nr:ABC transporter permease [Myxococcota bacterium]MDW8284393.1 ABC transporter permease [Myxococcales bacterium]